MTIDRRDMLQGVEADDAGAYFRQHGLDESASAFGLFARRFQRLLLRLQVGGHAVEGARQHGDVFGLLTGHDARRKVPGSHLVRRLHKPGHRAGNAFRRRGADPHRADQHQQHGLDIGQGEHELRAALGVLGVLDFGHGLLGDEEPPPQAGRQLAYAIEVGVFIAWQRVNVAQVGADRRAALGAAHPRIVDDVTRRGGIGRRAGFFGARQDLAGMIDDVDRVHDAVLVDRVLQGDGIGQPVGKQVARDLPFDLLLDEGHLVRHGLVQFVGIDGGDRGAVGHGVLHAI